MLTSTMYSEVQCSMVQCCTKVQQFMRSAEVECTLRRAATLDTFSDQVNQASDPSNLFGPNFGACHFFSTDSIAHPNPLKPFFSGQLCPGHLLSSQPIKVYLCINCACTKSIKGMLTR